MNMFRWLLLILLAGAVNWMVPRDRVEVITLQCNQKGYCTLEDDTSVSVRPGSTAAFMVDGQRYKVDSRHPACPKESNLLCGVPVKRDPFQRQTFKGRMQSAFEKTGDRLHQWPQ